MEGHHNGCLQSGLSAGHRSRQMTPWPKASPLSKPPLAHWWGGRGGERGWWVLSPEGLLYNIHDTEDLHDRLLNVPKALTNTCEENKITLIDIRSLFTVVFYPNAGLPEALCRSWGCGWIWCLHHLGTTLDQTCNTYQMHSQFTFLHIYFLVCVCECACVRTCVHACVCVCTCVHNYTCTLDCPAQCMYFR